MTDVPLSYARLAAHPDIELFHSDTEAMLSPGQHIHATPVPAGFMPDEFGRLQWQKTMPFAPEDFDLALCRTLKPFPQDYLSCLKQWSERLLFINDPAGIEKQLRLGFFVETANMFTPHTMITSNEQSALRFLRQHQVIVAKRGNSCGGRGVFRISLTPKGSYVADNMVESTHHYASFSQLYAHLTHNGAEEILLMRFLPRVTEGDKRIIVVDGKIFGTYLRTSSSDHWVQNVSFGGHCKLMSTEPEDQEIVAATHIRYKQAGIHILGYDLLKDNDGTWKVSEINAGNIGGLFRIEYLGIAGVTDRFVAWLHNFHAKNDSRQRQTEPFAITYH